ncbi:radical SAM protein [Bacillus sp. 1P06AnD]|uniref:radical SAM protein n=1 Tax=Bacillus sp. 1P06AnD TaxID=3132208 RepID=UPI0039A28135
MSKSFFIYNDQLGISIPAPSIDWEALPQREQSAILAEWENQRGLIPDRIKAIESEINAKQELMEQEDNLHASCILNTQIAQLASTINDLWLWFRLTPESTNERDKTHF